MRLIGAATLALLLCGCADADQVRGPSVGPTQAMDRLAQANSPGEKLAAAKEACAEAGQMPGTVRHAACVLRLLRLETPSTRGSIEMPANRAATHRYTCVDEARMRLVRCYDI